MNEASWRSISKTQLNIFTTYPPGSKGGIFTRAGTLKTNDPMEVGDFVCQLSIDENGYKKDYDQVANMWVWRVNRNLDRGLLEEKFGYDIKHAAHTIRLLIGGINIIKTGDYHPRLTGDNLRLVRSILSGEKTYEEVLELSIKLENEFNMTASTSTLPETADRKKANALLLELSRWDY